MVYGDLIYSFAEDGTIIITGCEGTSYTLEILSEINGVAVTAIADNAFDGCSWLTSAKISDNVLAIGDRVFSDCKSLAEIEFKGSSRCLISVFFDFACFMTVYYKSSNI